MTAKTKILAPARRKEDIGPLLDAGAGEFYFGWVPQEWGRKLGYAKAPNQRSSPAANFDSLADVRAVIDAAHERGAKIRMTLNAHCFGRDEVDLILPVVEQLAEAAIDAFIVTDLGLMRAIAALNLGPQIDVSCGAAAMNAWSVEFLHELGASRVVLPREVLVREACEIKRTHPDVEIEVFVFNVRCFFVDGLCTTIHYNPQRSRFRLLRSGPTRGGVPALCSQLFGTTPTYRCTNGDALADTDLEERLYANHQAFDRFQACEGGACGLCAVRNYVRAGVDSLKIVGRGMPIERLCDQTRQVSEAIELAAVCEDQPSFRDTVISRFRSNDELCCEGIPFGCYVSDARGDEGN